MRWFTICLAVGALLSPAIDARPLKRHSRCRPSAPVDYLSSVVSSSTAYVTSSSTTLDPVITPTDAEYTPQPTPDPEPTPEPTPDPEPTPEPEPEPEPENLVWSGDFEGDNSIWNTRTVIIREDPDKAASPTHYASWEINDGFASFRGRYLNQTVTSLDPGRLFRLSFSGAVFGLVDLKGATCSVVATIDNVERATWAIDTSVDGLYRSYSRELIIEDEDVVLAFDVVCATTQAITINFGMDDIVLNDVGPPPIVELPVPNPPVPK